MKLITGKSQGVLSKELLVNVFAGLLWVLAGLAFSLSVHLFLQRQNPNLVTSLDRVAMPTLEGVHEVTEEEAAPDVPLPGFEPKVSKFSISRQANLRTIIPTRARSQAITYTVQRGDSVFSIAVQFGLKPETVLWANYNLLDDNPNMLSVGQVLTIPPVDGVYYTWEQYDDIATVASRYKVTVEDILGYPPNHLDMSNPVIETGAKLMIPNGWRENRQWLVPTIWRANAGASRNIAGPGGCDLPDAGAYGTGAFIWPAGNHNLSGNDYWSGHLGIDIAAAEGAPLVAADSGLVVYAGPIGGGYGNMVMIDHGNGYHTLYAHLSSVMVVCGQSVYQGSLIGLAGSTGNSTGPHLHFEVRYNGGFINPWYVLP